MTKITPKDKLHALWDAAGGFVAFLGATYLLGELHGLALTAIGTILYTAFLRRQVIVLEHKLEEAQNQR